jgi:hypothetical protein
LGLFDHFQLLRSCACAAVILTTAPRRSHTRRTSPVVVSGSRFDSLWWRTLFDKICPYGFTRGTCVTG